MLQKLRIGLKKRRNGKGDVPVKQRWSVDAHDQQKDLNSTEMDSLTKSCSPTTVTPANGEVQTHEQTTVYVREMDLFLTTKVLEDTPAVLSLGKLCDEHGYSYEWINGQNCISLKMVFEYSVIRKVSYQSWFLVYQRVLLRACLLQRPRLLRVRKLIIQITVQQSSQVKVWIDKHGKTRTLLKHQKSCYMNQPKSQNQIKMRITNRYGEARIPTYQNGCKSTEKILWMTEFLNAATLTPVLLMNHL